MKSLTSAQLAEIGRNIALAVEEDKHAEDSGYYNRFPQVVNARQSAWTLIDTLGEALFGEEGWQQVAYS
jgi:hypothetical protein